jgi:hypothetical protein
MVGAGLGGLDGLNLSRIDFSAFIDRYLDPQAGIQGEASDNPRAAAYLPKLGELMNLAIDTPNEAIWAAYSRLLKDENPDGGIADQSKSISWGKAKQLALEIFYLVLRDAGRDHNNPDKPGFGNYGEGNAAISALFPGKDAAGAYQWPGLGDIYLSSRDIRTTSGGDIALLAPGGKISLGTDLTPGANAAPPGIVTEHGGNIHAFALNSVDVGVSRIFTLRGGDIVVWSSLGDIAAGVSSKTVQSAPPTRVLINPQSADVFTDLAGLATGGGIGVLATVTGVPPGDVDLIAPTGAIDAGDAGIRASGNLNLAARVVLNASNIQVGGAIAGTPPPPAPPNLAPLTAASNASAVASSAANDVAKQETAATQTQMTEVPSIITVEVLGYGGEDDNDTGNDVRRDNQSASSQPGD